MRATTLAVTTANAISVAWSNRPRCIRYLTSFYNVHKEGAVAHAGIRSPFTNETGTGGGKW